MGLMDMLKTSDPMEKFYAAAEKSNVPQGGITGKLFSAMFPHGLGNLAFGREPEPLPPLETPDGTALMADLASNMMVPGTFIGPKGLARLFGDDAAKGMLATAESKLAQGVPKEAVFQELGIFKGPEGKWRYEIDDSGMVFRDGLHEKLRGGNVPGVGDVIQHNELLRAHPEIADHGFEYSASIPGAGAYDQAREVVTINPMLGGQKSTTLHELQHAVQEREGFARGGDVDAALGMGGEMPAEFQLRTGGTVTVRGGSAYFVRPDGSFAPITTDTAMRIWREEGAPTAFQQYQNLAGEAEARAVQDRMNMSMDERRALFPEYAGRSDLIVRGLMSGGK